MDGDQKAGDQNNSFQKAGDQKAGVMIFFMRLDKTGNEKHSFCK